MQPLRIVGEVEAPGPDESWQELADASFTHDDVDHPRRTVPPDPSGPVVI